MQITVSSPRHLQALRVHSTPVLLGLLLGGLTLVLVGTGSPILVRIGTGLLINVVLVTGLFVFIGNSGVLSFGHFGFVAVGAYMTAWLTMKPAVKQMMLTGLPDFVQTAQVAPLAASLCAGLSAAFLALVTGVVIMRLSGIAAAIATLAFLAIVNTVVANADPVTGGTGSLAGIPTNLGIWTALAWAAVAILAAHLHGNSAVGLALRAIREDETAARACGISGYRTRLVAYVVSAFLCGVAGDLQARFLGVISPDSFYIAATFAALTMLIIGGVASLTGAVVGVLAVGGAMEALARLEGAWGAGFSVPSGTADFLIAAGMCLLLVKRPQGLVGPREWMLPLILGARPSPLPQSLTTNEQN